ncbi:unnamed protein product, partial [Coregonus sp. 'balchen']
MGACRRVWRLGGCVGPVLAWIGALFLGSSLAQPPPASCPTGVPPSNLSQPQYQSIPGADTGFMSAVVQSFLHTVQPNPFPKVGFLVCAAIGIVYIILMPLVGFCLACCRCCGHCGGRMYQRQTKAQIDSVLIESNKTVDEVTRSLNNIGPLLGREIQRSLEGPLNHALQSVSDMANVVNSTSILLVRLDSTLTHFQSDVAVVQANVSSVRDRINSTLRNPNCNECSADQSELQKLTFDTVTIPSLSELQSAVDNVTKADLNSKVKEGEDFFASIPQKVTNDTKDVQLEDIKRQIFEVKGNIPVSTLSNISDTLGEAQRYISICVVLLVVVCNLLGLFLGPVGLSSKDVPTERSSTADCGGTFLMAPLWTTLHLYELIDLNDLLNVSKYTEEIQQHFDSNDIKLSTITLLTHEIRKQLHSFSAIAHDVDFSSVRQQINNIASINLNETADRLDKLAAIQPDRGIQLELTQETTVLREIQLYINTTIIPQLTQLNSTIVALSVIASHINRTLGDVLSKVGTAQDFLNTNTSQIVKAESKEFLDCQMGYFMAYADWANLTNAFWFSLGWCMIFFVPSIIFSINLAKFYRRMKHTTT